MRPHFVARALFAVVANFLPGWIFAFAYRGASMSRSRPKSKRVSFYVRPDRRVIQRGLDRISVGFQLPRQRQSVAVRKSPADASEVNVLTTSVSHPHRTCRARAVSSLQADSVSPHRWRIPAIHSASATTPSPARTNTSSVDHAIPVRAGDVPNVRKAPSFILHPSAFILPLSTPAHQNGSEWNLSIQPSMW
jgi:hypothetical protein